jgi:hypothetical protein
MRKPRLITGFNNSQKIRVIVDGVGFYTTVGGTSDIMTRQHRMAVQTALMNLHANGGTGFAFNYNYYEGTTDNNACLVPVQVDLL